MSWISDERCDSPEKTTHVAQLTRETIDKTGWGVLPRPPYIPDLSPIHCHLYDGRITWEEDTG